jgi:hypothetical protein
MTEEQRQEYQRNNPPKAMAYAQRVSMTPISEKDTIFEQSQRGYSLQSSAKSIEESKKT